MAQSELTPEDIEDLKHDIEHEHARNALLAQALMDIFCRRCEPRERALHALVRDGWKLSDDSCALFR